MTADEKRRAAFAQALAEHPDSPPTPTELNRILGSRSTNKISWSKLRRALLLEAGFTKDPDTGRWK